MTVVFDQNSSPPAFPKRLLTLGFIFHLRLIVEGQYSTGANILSGADYLLIDLLNICCE